MVPARLSCWARRTITNPPTASAKTRTTTAPASCVTQLLIRPNNGDASEKVRQLPPQQLPATGVAVGRQQLAHPSLSQGDHRFDGLAGALDRLGDDQPNRFPEPEVLGAGERHRQHRDTVVDGEVREPLLEG